MNCYRAAVAAGHFSPFPSNKIATWPPVCQGNMGYLGVLILTTVNKTKRTSVFIWYSATFPALSYQACPRGSVLNAKQPGFAEKNTVWWSSAWAASLSAYRLKIWYWDASVISWRGGEYCRRCREQAVSEYSTDSGNLYLFYSTGLSRLI